MTDELELDVAIAVLELGITILEVELETITGGIELGITIAGLELDRIMPEFEVAAILFPTVDLGIEELAGFVLAGTYSGGTTAPTAPGT